MDVDSFGRAAPPTSPLRIAGASGTPSGLSAVMSGSDAEAELVKGLLDHQMVLSSRATKAMVFLRLYAPEVADAVERYRRYHQRPSGLVKALDAVAIKEFMQGVTVSLGNKG